MRTPTELEKQDHYNSGHARYRTWCAHCVAAKGQGNPHKIADGGPSSVPELAFDYFYFGTGQEQGLPSIACKDRVTGSFAGTTLENKGRNQYAKAYLVGWIRGLGYKRVVARSDNENSVLALLKEVSKEMPEVEFVPKSSIEGDHQQNGLAEVAVREVKGQARVLKSHLESNYGRRMDPKEPILAWIVRHAANVINRGRIGPDGQTPEQRRVGKKWSRPTVVFGEQVFYRPPGDRPGGQDMRMHRGVYVGHHERTGAVLLLTPSGLARGAGITRLPEGDRFNNDFLEKCKGLPWDVKPRTREVGAPIDMSIGEGAAPIEPRAPRVELEARRRYITIAEVEKYGGTEACPACTRMHMGERGARGAHTDACRARFEELWRQDESDEAVARREADALRQSSRAAPRAELAGSTAGDGQGSRAAPREELAGGTAGDEEPRSKRGRGSGLAGSTAGGGSSGSGHFGRPGPAGSPAEIQAESGTKRARGDDAEESWNDLRDRLRAVRAQAAEAPNMGQKRKEPEGGHLDEDVAIRSRDRDDEPAGSPAGAGDGDRGAAADRDGDMSMGKLELVPAVAQQLRKAYDRHGTQATDDEIDRMARVCVQLSACDAAGIHQGGKPNRRCGGIGLYPGVVVDLTSEKSEGTYWDLAADSDFDEIMDVMLREKPNMVIGAPPSSRFRCGSSGSATTSRGSEDEKRCVERHIEVYIKQLEQGGHFLHEHPADSDSWASGGIKKLMEDPRVVVVRGPICKWCLEGSDHQPRASTQWLTSSSEVACALAGSSAGARGSKPPVWLRALRAGPGESTYVKYSPRLMSTILEATARQLRSDGVDLHSFAAGPHNDEPELIEEAEYEEAYVDDISGKQLSTEDVRTARRLEMEWIEKQNVLQKVPLETALAEQGRLHDMKWIDKQKGPIVRSRLVVREIKARKKMSERLDPATVFAAMPPVEAVKILISHMQTEKVNHRGEPLEMMVFDISRAHFYGLAKRRVFTKLPEGFEEPGMCALLLKTMYGTEDAASIWEDTWSQHLVKFGVKLGRASPALFTKEGQKGMCHGDDFAVVASRQDLLSFEEHLKKAFEMRRTGHLGYAEDCESEISILGRLIRIDRENRVVELEADPKHVEELTRMYGLGKARAAATPRTKIDAKETDRMEASKPLVGEEITKFRSGAMRAAYLSADRPDLSESVKVLARAMSKPCEAHVVLLKRLIRYLVGRPRMVIRYPEQDAAQGQFIEAYVDSDWAGDVGSRKSTSGMCIMRGCHLLKHSSTLQASIGLSSAEAEYYAAVRGASYALGTQSYMRDLDLDVKVRLHSDSSAAKQFAKRRGLGKMRHIQTRHLWLQDRVRLKHLQLATVLGTENPADLLTKVLTQSEAEKHLAKLGVFAYSRAAP